MVGARRLLTVTLAWLLMSAKTPGTDGFGQSSIVGADLNETEETPDSPGSANTSGIIDAPDSEQSENGTKLGCPCDLNRCEKFCCPRGYSYSDRTENCTVDSLTPQVQGFEGSIEKYHVMSHVIHRWNGSRGYECWHTLIPHSRNGSICLMNVSEYSDLEDYCLYRELNKSSYGILRCTQLSDPNEMVQEDTNGDTFFRSWIIACMGSASLVALATFIVYSLVPELKNFQGRMVRSYLASYFGCMMCMTSICSTFERPRIALLFQVALLIYFGSACLLWLNVMSFDIWRTFRKFRSNQAVDAKDRQRATFVRYSTYAWGIPVLPVAFAASRWISGAYTWIESFDFWVVLPVSGIFVCNTYFFVSTALTIGKCNKETAQMVDDASKHRQKSEQRFNLYLKLFLIMGCPIVLWAVLLAWNDIMFLLVVFSVEPLQAICVFYMFVWKDDVKTSIRKQFSGMLRRLGCCRRRDSTSDIQNGI